LCPGVHIALFWFLSGALVGVAASLVALPLWRGTLTLGRVSMRYALAGGFVAVFAGAAAVIYLASGSRHSLTPHAADGTGSSAATGMSMPAAVPSAGTAAAGGAAKSMDAAVAGLEARLARQGGSDDDWKLLAKAYDVLGRPEDARRARAHTVSPGAGLAPMSAGALVAAATAAETAASSAPRTSATAAPAASGAASRAELERRLKANPSDAGSWLALAELRRSQRDNAGARDALAKVVTLHGMTGQSWADYADVLASLNGGALTGAAGNAIDQAIALDPANPKALWLKASQAHDARHFTEALAWWRKLRDALPPDSPDIRAIDGNIAEDTSLAGLPAAGPATAAPAAGAAAPASAEISGTVSIDSRLAERVQRDATLFIYAKAADSPGPPLAVMRTTAATWPVSFRLDDSMAMLPSRRLSQFDKVIVEARISRSGQATPGSGDLYVTSPVLHPAAGTKLALVINREIG
jgi:cytochrome c-type biogenesis protein CcmH